MKKIITNVNNLKEEEMTDFVKKAKLLLVNSKGEIMLGNERSLKLKEWKNLIEKVNGELVECTSFHYYKFFSKII